MPKCPKQDRCMHGLNCPQDYFPSAQFLCFENWQSENYKKNFHERYCSRDERRAYHKKFKERRG